MAAYRPFILNELMTDFSKCFCIIWKPWKEKKKESQFTLWKQLLTAIWEAREV